MSHALALAAHNWGDDCYGNAGTPVGTPGMGDGGLRQAGMPQSYPAGMPQQYPGGVNQQAMGMPNQYMSPGQSRRRQMGSPQFSGQQMQGGMPPGVMPQGNMQGQPGTPGGMPPNMAGGMQQNPAMAQQNMANAMNWNRTGGRGQNLSVV